MLEALEALLRRDPARRGVAAFALPGQLAPAARALLGARGVVIVSGFPVATPSGFVPETDGPPGALALGRALTRLGVPCRYATGPRSAALFEGLGCLPLDALDLRPGDAAAARAYLEAHAPSHLVAIERPARGPDGRYRTMRGQVLEQVAALDELFLVAAETKVTTIGIGDGGNEVGLGRVRAQVEVAVPHGAAIASVVPVDHLLVAGISTWGAWTLAAALAALGDSPTLLPSTSQAREDLERVVALGGVDGITGDRAPTLDGVGWDACATFLEALRAAVEQG